MALLRAWLTGLLPWFALLGRLAFLFNPRVIVNILPILAYRIGDIILFLFDIIDDDDGVDIIDDIEKNDLDDIPE